MLPTNCERKFNTKRDGCWETRQKKPITLFWVTKLTFSGKRAYQHQTIQPERHDFLGKYLRICVVMIFMCTLQLSKLQKILFKTSCHNHHANGLKKWGFIFIPIPGIPVKTSHMGDSFQTNNGFTVHLLYNDSHKKHYITRVWTRFKP